MTPAILDDAGWSADIDDKFIESVYSFFETFLPGDTRVLVNSVDIICKLFFAHVPANKATSAMRNNRHCSHIVKPKPSPNSNNVPHNRNQNPNNCTPGPEVLPPSPRIQNSNNPNSQRRRAGSALPEDPASCVVKFPTFAAARDGQIPGVLVRARVTPVPPTYTNAAKNPPKALKPYTARIKPRTNITGVSFSLNLPMEAAMRVIPGTFNRDFMREAIEAGHPDLKSRGVKWTIDGCLHLTLSSPDNLQALIMSGHQVLERIIPNHSFSIMGREDTTAIVIHGVPTTPNEGFYHNKFQFCNEWFFEYISPADIMS